MKKISIILILLIIGYTSLIAEVINIRVTESTPIYGTVTISEPYVYYKKVPVNRSYNCNYKKANQNEIGLDTIIGAGLGVVLGNQIGRGNGRTAAKILLGTGGAYTANHMRRGNYDRCNETVYERRRFTDYQYTEVDKIIGYRNCGYVGNRRICKESKRKKRHIYLRY